MIAIRELPWRFRPSNVVSGLPIFEMLPGDDPCERRDRIPTSHPESLPPIKQPGQTRTLTIGRDESLTSPDIDGTIGR